MSLDLCLRVKGSQINLVYKENAEIGRERVSVTFTGLSRWKRLCHRWFATVTQRIDWHSELKWGVLERHREGPQQEDAHPGGHQQVQNQRCSRPQ